MNDKLDLQSTDINSLNIEKIAILFPNCVTETAEGRKIDFDLLKQELSTEIVEGNKERYRLEWPGKRESIVTANLPTTNTLRPVREDSVDFDTTENIYIEGDNLEVLKLLQESYLNKIKMIYIDPPYNTGKDFVYKDNFAKAGEEELFESGQKDEYNQRLVANPETNGRYHSDWLSMMYPRLKLARNLLTEDGVIFISIDDNEVHNLRKICDEIFGENNFVCEFIWKSKSGGSADEKFIVVENEYILLYGKSKSKSSINKIMEDSSKYILQDNFIDERGKYLLKKLDFRMTLSHFTESLNFPVKDPDGNDLWPGGEDYRQDGGWNWRWSKTKIKWGFDNGFLEFKKNKSKWVLNSKQYEKVNNEGVQVIKTLPYRNIIDDASLKTTTGSRYIVNQFGSKVFEYPKPFELLTLLTKIGTDSESTVLDFFSGSASFAHSILKHNAEDEGNRKYIMVQLPEATDEKTEAYKAGYATICEIGKERIRRASNKIKEEKIEKAKKDGLFADFKDEQDYGFRVYRLDSSNMQDVYYKPQDYNQGTLDLFADNVKEGRTAEDLLTQVMLDWGLPLSLPIERKTISGKEAFAVAGDSLYCCFDDGIDEAFAKEIAQEKPLRIVFRDKGFKDDTAKENVKQLLKQLSGGSEMKVI